MVGRSQARIHGEIPDLVEIHSALAVFAVEAATVTVVVDIVAVARAKMYLRGGQVKIHDGMLDRSELVAAGLAAGIAIAIAVEIAPAAAPKKLR